MRITGLFLLVLISFSATAQHKRKAKPVNANPKVDIFDKYMQCYHHNKYSALQRKTFFPFNKATEIKLIGFRANWDKVILETGQEDTTVANAGKKPMYVHNTSNHYDLNEGRLVKSISLNLQGIDSLTDILYNYGYTPVKLPKNITLIDEPTGCYEPRNAILFLDANGNIIEYMEFCFACEQFRWSSQKFREVNFCTNKYAMLRKFLFDNGITYGTEKN